MDKLRKNSKILATVGPYALVIIFLVILPVAYIALMSIMTRPSYGGVEFTVSFNAFKSLFEKAWLVSIWNAFKMSLYSTIIILLVSYPLAYILSKCSRKVSSNLIILMMVPYFTNGLVRLYSYVTLFSAKGIVVSFLSKFGFTGTLDILYTEGAVILGLVYVCIPYAVLPIYSSLERINASVLEASYDLGASKFRTFTKITFPLSMPGVYAAAIISFVPSIGNYFVSDVLGGGKTLLIGSIIKNQFMSSRNWPLGSALSLLIIGGTLILVYIYTKISKGDELGGVL